MDTDETQMKTLAHEALTKEIIGAELIGRGLRAEIEHPLKVMYKETLVGDYFADLLVEEAVVVELKIAAGYNPQDEAQLLNELKASCIKVGLLINFGRTKVEFKRLVY